MYVYVPIMKRINFQWQKNTSSYFSILYLVIAI